MISLEKMIDLGGSILEDCTVYALVGCNACVKTRYGCKRMEHKSCVLSRHLQNYHLQ